MNLKAVLFQFLPTVPTKKVIEVSSHTDTHIQQQCPRSRMNIHVNSNTYYIVILCGFE